MPGSERTAVPELQRTFERTNMKSKTVTLTVIALAVLSVSAFRSAQWKPTISEDDRMRGSYRFDRNGWIYVHLEGSPEQIGYQHGKLLAKETEDLLRVINPFLHHETKLDWEFNRKDSQEIMRQRIVSVYQREIAGSAIGLHCS